MKARSQLFTANVSPRQAKQFAAVTSSLEDALVVSRMRRYLHSPSATNVSTSSALIVRGLKPRVEF